MVHRLTKKTLLAIAAGMNYSKYLLKPHRTRNEEDQGTMQEEPMMSKKGQ